MATQNSEAVSKAATAAATSLNVISHGISHSNVIRNSSCKKCILSGTSRDHLGNEASAAASAASSNPSSNAVVNGKPPLKPGSKKKGSKKKRQKLYRAKAAAAAARRGEYCGHEEEEDDDSSLQFSYSVEYFNWAVSSSEDEDDGADEDEGKSEEGGESVPTVTLPLARMSLRNRPPRSANSKR